MTIVEVQKALIALGYDLGPAGADGDYGKRTKAAVEAFQFAERLHVDGDAGPITTSALKAAVIAKQVSAVKDIPPAGSGLIPASWMPSAQIKRIVMHWTAGTHKATGFDREHYHLLIEDDGKLIRGIPTIDKNDARGTKAGYAAHALNCNTGSIGISLCSMADASDSPFRVGKYPITQMQIDTLCRAVAELCAVYKIAVTPSTVLSHAEIQGTLGIQQRGKIDIMWLPGMTRMVDASGIGDKLRQQIVSNL